MDDRMGRSLDCFKGLLDNMLSRLRKYLYRHIIRYHVLFDQRAHKLVLRLGRSRKSHLDLLKSDIHQQLEKFQFFFQAHWLYQGLVAIPQVYAAPDRRLLYRVLPCPVVSSNWRHKIRFLILLIIFHVIFLSFYHNFE